MKKESLPAFRAAQSGKEFLLPRLRFFDSPRSLREKDKDKS
jgi:hypothetical protein